MRRDWLSKGVVLTSIISSFFIVANGVSLRNEAVASDDVVVVIESTESAESEVITTEVETTEIMQAIETIEYAEMIKSTEQREEESSTLADGMDLDGDESYMLCKIAMAEAEGESTEGKALVMLVVLNRVSSDGFPNTIEGVIFQAGQFSPIADGRYYNIEPNEDCWKAYELITVDKWDESQGALFFEACTSGSWHSESLEYLFQYGNHRFYR